MLHRGLISPAQHNDLLKALDYAPTWRPRLRELARRIPPISDMIRFAVREVYDPASRAELGLDTDYPPEFTPEAALHGMDEERAQQYWAAHWRLPSAQQGYRMLWRGEISEAQLDGLLKALDYPPVWRERLANIARLVPGRIDLKRMLKHEILTEAQVFAGYQRLGYAPADARHMTDIAVAELQGGGQETPWLDRAKSRLFTVTHNEYLDGSIDAARARDLLGDVGVPAGQRATIVALWDSENTISRVELTVAQIRRAYKKDRLDRPTAFAMLVDRGITADDVNILLDTV
jgi:hypothetical protein